MGITVSTPFHVPSIAISDIVAAGQDHVHCMQPDYATVWSAAAEVAHG